MNPVRIYNPLWIRKYIKELQIHYGLINPLQILPAAIYTSYISWIYHSTNTSHVMKLKCCHCCLVIAVCDGQNQVSWVITPPNSEMPHQHILMTREFRSTMTTIQSTLCTIPLMPVLFLCTWGIGYFVYVEIDRACKPPKVIDEEFDQQQLGNKNSIL